LFLTRAAMEGAGTPIFLMDTLTGLYVLYTEKAPADTPVPPAQDGAFLSCRKTVLSNALLTAFCLFCWCAAEIRKTIKKIKARAPLLTPRVVFARAGSPPARFFDANLLEEADSAGFSYTQFAESVAGAVVLVLRG
jgi:hypothetical protein